MSDKIFIDTNIWLYALIESDEHIEKHHKAKQSIANVENIIISTQVKFVWIYCAKAKKTCRISRILFQNLPLFIKP